MRRLATLVVVAVAAVGCTKGGEAGPAGAQGIVTTARSHATTCTLNDSPIAFGGTTVNVTVAAGQKVMVIGELDVNSNATNTGGQVVPCYRVAGTAVAPTAFAGSPSITHYPPWSTVGGWAVTSQANRNDYQVFATAGTYQVGLCTQFWGTTPPFCWGSMLTAIVMN